MRPGATEGEVEHGLIEAMIFERCTGWAKERFVSATSQPFSREPLSRARLRIETNNT